VQRFALLFPPVLSGHLLGTFLRTTSLCIAAFLSIYIIVEFFDRFDNFLELGASAGAIVRYFFFRIPMFVTRIIPMAVLAGILLGLGNLGRHNEFVALRAAGISVWQISTPLLLAATVISGAVLFWNERVVPYCSQRAHDVYAGQIRQQPIKGQGRQQVWYRGVAGFYNIEHVSEDRLVGLTVYQLGRDFQPRRIVEVERARWREDEKAWKLTGARTYRLRPGGAVEAIPTRGFTLPEPPSEFLATPGEAEEFSFGALRRHVAKLQRTGEDPGDYFVELHLKLAVPFASLVMAMIAIPLATRGTRTSNLAGAVTFGLAIGFAYWVVLAFTKALGEGGALAPGLAAWAANGIFLLVGTFLFLGNE
jgi:lipopolysaccharide export system permease protein